MPIHWAVSYGHLDIAILLASRKDFDPDVQVGSLFLFWSWFVYFGCVLTEVQDGAGWTPLMIAVSLKDGEDLVKLFLSKGADVNAKSKLLPQLSL